MIKTLKKKTFRYFLPWLIITAVIALILLGLSCQSMFLRIAGPTSLSNYNESTISAGDYVSFDASDVIVAVATLSSSSSDDSSSTVLKTYYLLPIGDNSYMAVVDKKEANSDVLDKAMDQSYNYYLGDLETLSALGQLSGTVKTLESDMNSYMTDVIEEYTLPGYEEGLDLNTLICPYQIELQNIGFLSGTLSLVLFIAGLVFLLIFLALLISICAGVYQKKALAEVRSELTEEESEKSFAASQQVESVLVGDYIWYQKGANSRVLRTEDIIWGYMMPEPLVVSKYRWPVALYNAEQDMTQICFMEKKQGQKLLDTIAEAGHPFVNGYTTSYSQLFKTNLDAFLKVAAEQAAARQKPAEPDAE